MSDNDEQLEQYVRTAMFDLMLTLYKAGITEIHVGGMMRILGVDDELASAHDDERLVIDNNFVKYVEQIQTPITPGQTLH